MAQLCAAIWSNILKGRHGGAGASAGKGTESLTETRVLREGLLIRNLVGEGKARAGGRAEPSGQQGGSAHGAACPVGAEGRTLSWADAKTRSLAVPSLRTSPLSLFTPNKTWHYYKLSQVFPYNRASPAGCSLPSPCCSWELRSPAWAPASTVPIPAEEYQGKQDKGCNDRGGFCFPFYCSVRYVCFQQRRVYVWVTVLAASDQAPYMVMWMDSRDRATLPLISSSHHIKDKRGREIFIFWQSSSSLQALVLFISLLCPSSAVFFFPSVSVPVHSSSPLFTNFVPGRQWQWNLRITFQDIRSKLCNSRLITSALPLSVFLTQGNDL